MALSLDAIHKPLNDFFLDHFQASAGSPVLFRFDKFGSAISDQDFIVSGHPELGYSDNLATELFSDLVNRVPVEDDDGLNVFVSQAQIDQAYFGFLSASLPFVPPGTADDLRDAEIASFSQIKSDALKIWENVKAESSTGLMFQFKPSLAGPKDWYDKAQQDNWTRQSFQITEAADAPPANDAPKFQLWRKKIDDATIQQIVPLNESAQMAAPAELAATVLRANPIRPMLAHRAVVSLPVSSATPLMAVRPNPMMAVRADSGMAVRSLPSAGFAGRTNVMEAPQIAARSFAAQDNLLSHASELQFGQRLAVVQYLAAKAPTQPASTNSISITFDHCLVNITRPWYRDAFITNRTWFMPNTAKGELTTRDDKGANLTLIPIGVVVIKNLKIEANWSASDVANSQDATEFGPFKVSSGITNNALSHEGIQVVGWLLQRMPELPPNDPPGA